MYTRSIGFGLIISWLWLFYLQGPLLFPFTELWHASPDSAFYWFMLAAWVTYFTLSKIIRLKTTFDKKHLLTGSAILLAACPLLTAVLANTFVITPATVTILAAISGIAEAPFMVAWMQTFSFLGIQKLSLSFAFSMVIAGTVTILGGMINPYVGLFFVSVFPLISLVLLFHQIRLCTNLPSTGFAQTDSTNPFPVKLTLLILSLYPIGGTMFTIISLNQSFVDMFVFSNTAYCIACLIAGYFLYKYQNLDLRYIYKPVLPLLSTGFLLFSSQGDTFAPLSFLLLQAGLALFDMYTWLIFPYFAQFSTRPAAVCAFGLFLTTVSIWVGNQLVPGIASLISGGISLGNLSLIAGILSVLLVFIFQDKSETFSGWQTLLDSEPKPASPQAKPEPTIFLPSPKVPKILTEREKAVLHLILKGRSGKFISEALNISANTVKYHTRNIYQKLDVNNRQELLTLFEEIPPS
ncbi:MAG: hypothetical protein H6Q75_53 [Firmicutes bacterium]|nr:hypothetical protein [Bacillota bacterium]